MCSRVMDSEVCIVSDSNSSEDETAMEVRAVRNCRRGCKTRRGVKLTVDDDQIAQTQIYTSRVNNYMELNDKIPAQYLTTEGLTSVEKRCADRVTMKSDTKKEKLTDSDEDDIILEDLLDGEVEEVDARSRSPTPPPSLIEQRNIKKRRMKPKMKKIMNNLEQASLMYRALKDNNRSFSLEEDDVMNVSDDIICEDDITVSRYDLKIKIHSKINRYPIQKNQEFFHVIKDLSMMHSVSFNDIILTLNDAEIMPEDTPLSIKLTSADIIEGYIVNQNKSSKESSSSSVPSDVDKNCIRLKLQSKDSKKKLDYTCNKYLPLQEVLNFYSEKNSLPIKKLVVHFDGEKIDPHLTMFEFGMEDGDCLDIFVAK